jgi:tetratricopeptide (TPR) repeat protein
LFLTFLAANLGLISDRPLQIFRHFYYIFFFNFNFKSLEFAIKPKSSEADEEDLDDVDVEAAKDMALAFANRSAVWSDRGEFALAIRDADLAFDAAYPDELKHKLFERKGQCLVGLGKTKEAKAMLQKAVEYLAKSNIKGAERKKAKEKTLEKLISDLLEDANVAAEPAAKMASDLSIKYVRKLIPDLQGDDQHPKFPNFSSAIKVEYDPKGVRGRYCVASRTIEPGELLAVETPYVWLLDKEAARIHCWHCFRPVLAPVPCFQCAGILKTSSFLRQMVL